MAKSGLLLVLAWGLGVSCAAGLAHAQGGHGAHQGPAPTSQEPPGQAEELPATIEIPPEKRQLIGVRTAEVKEAPFLRTIRTVGRIEYDERRLATVNTKFEGWIEKLHVDYTGRYVKKGEVLAEIYSPELLATQQEFLNLLHWSRSKRETGPLGGELA